MSRHHFTTRDVGRISAFSDAIFAIALTLPVLELRLPPGSGSLLAQLQAALPALYAYLVTFAVGVTQWVAHYRLFSATEQIDGDVLSRNNVFLFLFSLLPFTTALVMGHRHEALTVVIFALNVAALSLSLIWVTNRLLACGYLREDQRTDIRHGRARSFGVSAIFLLEAGLALFAPDWALWTPLLLPIVFRLPELWHRLGRGAAR